MTYGKNWYDFDCHWLKGKSDNLNCFSSQTATRVIRILSYNKVKLTFIIILTWIFYLKIGIQLYRYMGKGQSSYRSVFKMKQQCWIFGFNGAIGISQDFFFWFSKKNYKIVWCLILFSRLWFFKRELKYILISLVIRRIIYSMCIF